MKKLLFLSLTILSLLSCSKAKEIGYPQSLDAGDNVLAIGNVAMDRNYSLGASLGKKATLKIVLTNLSAQANVNQPKPVWFTSNVSGWDVSEYATNDTQTFTSNKHGDIALGITFTGTPGSCRVDYYENSSSVTKTKVLSW